MTIKSTIDAQHLQQDIDKVSMWTGKYKIPYETGVPRVNH
jgi:hypothetical protein